MQELLRLQRDVCGMADLSVSDGSAFSHNPLRLRAHNIKPYSWPSGVTVQCLSGGGDAEASCVHALVDIVNFLIRKPTPAPASSPLDFPLSFKHSDEVLAQL
ncbi:hypothetical protein ROHU_008584 [Labeo rohita]|uniref:Uncharacterized protein n=1 Tax=Labeo rohita TaxID=84645 RepID=A0A498M7Q1_LABRO|nr:hypothetical protein ROHU_008584 [Labeo rohita]